MLEILAMPFMQRALIGALLVGVVSGYFGPFIVQRRLAFLGSGLAHGAFGGVALGIFLGVQPLWVAAPFTAIVAVAIVWLRNQSELETDTTIGIFFALSMALGIIFLGYTEGYARDAFAYLFGSVFAVTATDLWTMGAVALLTIATVPLWSRWAYATFDANLSKADRIPVTRHDYFLVVAIAVAVVAAIKVVGIVLMAAFLVLPPATARLLARTFGGMTALSIIIGAATALAGIIAAYYTDLPGGPAIILVQGAAFFAALIGRRLFAA
jgi:zinc transport system permease protein